MNADRRMQVGSSSPASPPGSGPTEAYKAYLRKQKRHRNTIRGMQLLVLLVVLGLWELAADWKWVDSMLTSKPSQIVTSFRELLGQGQLLHHTWVTTLETIIGIVVSMVLGTVIAIAFWWSSFTSRILDPYMVVLNALPKVALGPIFYIWLGDRYSIYGMAIAISLIVTIMMIESGFKEIGKSKQKLMESFGATRWQTLHMVLLPASIPNIVAALKVNVGLTLVGVIMGEFLSSKAGLGFLIIYGGQVFQMHMVMTSIVILALLSIVLYGLVTVLGRMAMRKYHFDS
ncbi:sulfonate ABC transporter permease [Paenibacillus rigui]|uniref:Sulfonate ABC transporter permease n=2 Tax=Paenibacillus rigui TaxID=554312 RepID=A0A229UR31_9BACL|nr:sulfonate ABC transporter permease [Paenibacillus rigui]